MMMQNIFAGICFRNESNLKLEESYGVARGDKSNGWWSEIIK